MSDKNIISRQINDYAKNIEELIVSLKSQATDVIPDANNISKIHLVGTGINYASGFSMKDAFYKYSGLTGECIEVTTPSAFETCDSGTLLISLDYSGSCSGCDMATKKAEASGGTVIKISAQREKGISVGAFSEQSYGDTDGYFRVSLALIIIALQIGIVKNTVHEDRYKEIVDDIISYTKEMSKCEVPNYTEFFNEVLNFEMVGTGGDYGVAWLLRAVVYKELGTVATVEESEDWLHVNMLCLTPEKFGCFTFVSSGNSAYDRTIRTLRYIKGVGRKTVIFTDLDSSEFFESYEIVPLVKTKFNFIKPLLMFVPAVYIIKQLSDIK